MWVRICRRCAGIVSWISVSLGSFRAGQGHSQIQCRSESGATQKGAAGVDGFGLGVLCVQGVAGVAWDRVGVGVRVHWEPDACTGLVVHAGQGPGEFRRWCGLDVGEGAEIAARIGLCGGVGLGLAA